MYKLAFRHKSAAQELYNGVRISNERLEYLGDAVLSAVIADYLFRRYPFEDEGFLTQTRAKIVSRAQLNNLARRLGFDQFIEAGNDNHIVNRYMEGDAFEAFIGALYLDKGYEFAQKVIVNQILQLHFNIDELINKDFNFKSKLIEWSQREKKEVEFKVIKEVGSGFKKQYVVELYINNSPVCRGQDFSIKKAEQNAAEKACEKLEIGNQ
ncbi:MAG: ribonuclease III [Bacteroidales bacterium]|nr:ribonuclease III [Bacteroidales bacterium]